MTTSNAATNSSTQYSEYIIQENDGTSTSEIKVTDNSSSSIDQQQHQHWHDAVQDGVPNGHRNNNNRNQSSESSEEARSQLDQSSNNLTPTEMVGIDGGVIVKTPNSYKYPLLRQYYSFGPWIGRNRKAICLRCRLQTSSSQPDRLLKHLNRCPKLSEAEKVDVQDLMNERTANKRKKPSSNTRSRSRDDHNDDTTEYYGDDKQLDDSGNPIPIPPGGLKKLKRGEHSDRFSQVDEALTRWIMMCRIPLKTVHSPEFVAFVKLLNPEYRLPSRETITNVLIPGMLDII